MNLKELAAELHKFEYAEEMIDHYYYRTLKHVDLVRNYCKKLYESFEGLEGLLERGSEHDESKLVSTDELVPYIFLTWRYKCQDEGIDFEVSDEIEELIHEATEQHVLSNRHHPEFHCPKNNNVINKEDRDKPPEDMIDAQSMGILDIAEMCADWCAMSEERGNTPQEWANKNVGIRWKFTKDQDKLIYQFIDEIWE